MDALVDSHCHIDVEAFAADRSAVLQRAARAGVVAQVVPAVAASAWAGLRTLSDARPALHPGYGLHPMYLESHRPQHLDQLAQLLATGTRCVAIGECGLDYFVPGLDRDAQRRYFEAQLDLAALHHLPVIVHARKALDDVLAAIRRRPGLRGVVHSFSGSAQQARQLWDHGFMLGIGGPVTYPRAQRLRGLVARMPSEFLLLETDSPDQPDVDWRGRRNEPSRLPRVLAEVALLRGEDPTAIATATTANARRLFGLPGGN